MKPIYKLLITFIILALLGLFIFFFFFNEKPEVVSVEPTQTNEFTGGASNTQSGEQGTQTNETSTEQYEETIKTEFTSIKKISDVPVVGYWYYKENNRIFYITTNGEIKKVIDGKIQAVSVNPLKKVSAVRSNSDGSFVLIKFLSGNNFIWGVFSSMDEQITPLSQLIVDATWDTNNRDIIANISQSGNSSIVLYNASSTYSSFQTLVPDLRLLDVDIYKKSSDELLFIEKFGDEYPSSIWLYNIKTKLFTTFKRGLIDFSINRADSVLFWTSKNDGFVVANTSFSRLFPVINKTFPAKCSASENTGFCFAPQNLPSFFSWITNSTQTSDSLYIYDLFAQDETQFDISKITTDPIDAKNVISTHSSLYFINKYTGYIYAFQ